VQLAATQAGAQNLEQNAPAGGASAMVQRRNLNLKAKVESGSSHFSFKRSVPGGFNVGLIGSTCTALPWRES